MDVATATALTAIGNLRKDPSGLDGGVGSLRDRIRAQCWIREVGPVDVIRGILLRRDGDGCAHDTRTGGQKTA